jgi:hypothetical protein
MRRLAVAVALWLGAAAALAACSPYDPPLPPVPFLCGDQEPRCPEGHVCVEDPDGREVCRAATAAPDARIDASAARDVR